MTGPPVTESGHDDRRGGDLEILTGLRTGKRSFYPEYIRSAERLEHAISLQVEALLLKRFGHDSPCPHGVPLFGGLPALRRQGAVTLSEAAAGDSLEILHVWEKDKRFLEFVDALRLRPGAHIKVHAREYDQTMTLVVEGRPKRLVHLGLPATIRIWVRHLSR